MKENKIIFVCLCLGLMHPWNFVYAQTNAENQAISYDLTIEELLNLEVVTGTRSDARHSQNSTALIEVYDAESFTLHGSGDTTMNLRDLVPSYTSMAKSGDGGAFIHFTTLRGLPADNMLLLLNSKRRHRSAHIQHGGPSTTAGAHGPDPGPLPTIAFKNIEVLQEGAASQYGSDAIAGVINFILKDSDAGGQFEVQWGEFYAGERTITVAFNKGFSLNDKGFINLSAEYINNEQLIRGVQPLAAQQAIDSGNLHIGLDSPYDGDNLAQTWGRSENRGLRTAWNSAYPLSDTKEVYALGNFADYYGNFRFFFRPPDHTSLQPLPLDPSDPALGNFCWCEQLPGGYTPYLQAKITDFSQVLGFRGDFNPQHNYDFSLSYGSNKIDYTLNNTLNPSFGPTSPRDLDIGDLKQEEINLNADFSYAFNPLFTLPMVLNGVRKYTPSKTPNLKPGPPAPGPMLGS